MTEQEINNNATQQEKPIENKPSEAERRIKELSDKVELTSKERDEKDTLIKERDVKIATLEKNQAFTEEFSTILEKNPNAKAYKDAIREKVNKGYSVQDATFAVLGAEGKLGGNASEPTNPAGGSADTVMNQSTTDKPVGEMTQEERRAILEKALALE